MRHPIKHVAEYVGLRLVGGFFCALPLPIGLALGAALAEISRLFTIRKQQEVERRIAQVFGTRLDRRGVRRVARRAWRNFFLNTVEMLRTPRLTPREVARRVNIEDIRLIKDYTQDGRGIVLALPHFGNWEYAGVAAQMHGLDLCVIVRRQKNLLVNEYLNRLRQRTGVVALEQGAQVLERSLELLARGRHLAILPDIRAKTRGVPVRWLGQAIEIYRGMGLFARRAHCAILPVAVLRKGWMRHEWRAFEPVRPDFSLDEETDIRRMSQHVMTALEPIIREQPEQFFWFNKRWLFQNEGEGGRPSNPGREISATPLERRGRDSLPQRP